MVHVLFKFSLFCVISVHGISLKDALDISHCLESCENEVCRYACNHSESPLDQNVPHIAEGAAANVSLHCRKADLIKIKYNPGTYVIEQSIAGERWAKAKVCNGIFCIFDNLMAGTPYQYRIYRLTVDGISQPEVSEIFFTFTEDYKPNPILNISLDNITADESNNNQLRAEISFKPAEDRTCDYYIRTWGGEHDLRHYTLQNVVNFRFFPYVDYDKTYDVNMSAQNGDKMSDVAVLKFSTPTCLEVYHNLDICAPLKVEQLEAREVHTHGPLYDLIITWKEPDLVPENYTIKIYQPQESSNDYVIPDITLLHKDTVPGNATKFVLSNIELRAPYEVCIFAEALGGTSPITSIINDQIAEADVIYDKLIGASATLISAVILIGILYACYCKGTNKHFAKKYTHFEKYSQKDILIEMVKGQQDDKSGGNISENMFRPHDKFQLCPSRLIIRGVLGSGAYGIVRLGMLRDDYGRLIDVAVKTLKENSTVEDTKNFHREIGIMKCAGRHPNIVSLVGYCTLQEGPALVVEYCCNGDLQSYLRKIWGSMMNLVNDRRDQFLFGVILSKDDIASDYLNGTYPLINNDVRAEKMGIIVNRLYDVQQDIMHSMENVTAADLLNFARQVAAGMDYLSSNRIVHRDLAARNVLVCAGRLVKISDFGLSRDIYQENVYKKRGNDKLPIKWMAIESLTHQVYTTHSDVWSFGILLWEIITLGATPYPGKSSNRILKLLRSGYRLERPSNCSIELYNLMLSCWNVRPQCRPSFADLKQSLDKFLCDYFGSTYTNMTGALKDSGDYEQLFMEQNNMYGDCALSR